MTQSEDSSDNEERHPGWGSRPWWEDVTLQRERLRTQVRLIVDSLPDVGVFTDGSGDLADTEFMYRLGVILVRDTDLERVRQVLGGPPLADDRDIFVRDGLIAGFTAVAV